jgi:DNA-binding NarL/FixJ family response regulator
VPVTVYLIDDHARYRRCVRDALAGSAVVAGEAGTGVVALAAAAAAAPLPLADVVLLDIRLPDADGVALARRLLALAPASRIVGLTALDDPVLRRALLQAGACGCVGKHEPPAALLEAVRKAAGAV